MMLLTMLSKVVALFAFFASCSFASPCDFRFWLSYLANRSSLAAAMSFQRLAGQIC